MKWIWMRHGETDLNRSGCYLGHHDVPLNDRGKRQIERVTDLVKDVEGVTKVFSSDLIRCRQTAEILVGASGVFIDATCALRELDFGRWDGKRYEEIMQVEAVSLTAWYQDPFRLSPPEGETLKQLGRRVDAWLVAAVEQVSKDDVVLVVTHGGPLRWVLSQSLVRDARQFWNVQGVVHGGGFVVEWNGARWGEPTFFGGEK